MTMESIGHGCSRACGRLQVFNIHDVIDDVRAVSYDGDVVYLEDVCFKPFGDACATQSIAQYWAMSREDFRSSGFASLKYCLSHWSTACRCAHAVAVSTTASLHCASALQC